MSSGSNSNSGKERFQDSEPSVQYNKDTVNFTDNASSPAEFKYYPDSPNSVLNKVRFDLKQASKFYDPCAESSKMSIRCLEVNGRENKAICNEYFQAYRDCKKEWLEQRKRDRLKGGW